MKIQLANGTTDGKPIIKDTRDDIDQNNIPREIALATLTGFRATGPERRKAMRALHVFTPSFGQLRCVDRGSKKEGRVYVYTHVSDPDTTADPFIKASDKKRLRGLRMEQLLTKGRQARRKAEHCQRLLEKTELDVFRARLTQKMYAWHRLADALVEEATRRLSMTPQQRDAVKAEWQTLIHS
jgi:hypothetical protein